MQSIKEYVFSLMIISISCAALNILTPERSSTSKYVHYIAALVVSTVLLCPIQSLVGVLPDIFDKGYSIPAYSSEESADIYTDNIISEAVKNIEANLEAELEGRLGCDVYDIVTEYDARDCENVIIERITVVYKEYDRYLFSDTENYTAQLLGCECEVKQREDG